MGKILLTFLHVALASSHSSTIGPFQLIGQDIKATVAAQYNGGTDGTIPQPSKDLQSSYVSVPGDVQEQQMYGQDFGAGEPDQIAGQSTLPRVPTVSSQRNPTNLGPDGSWPNDSTQSGANETSTFAPCVALGDQTFEFHVDLPLVDNYAIPVELTRTPTGSSVYDTESVFRESGRTYHGYKDGSYFLPNDGVRRTC
jgi:hypothetical protein